MYPIVDFNSILTLIVLNTTWDILHSIISDLVSSGDLITYCEGLDSQLGISEFCEYRPSVLFHRKIDQTWIVTPVEIVHIVTDNPPVIDRNNSHSLRYP